MITITFFRGGGGFMVNGHAGYGPPGHDIVCAGISTLVQTFVESAEAFTDAIVKSDLSPGRAIVTYRNPSERLKLLEGSFLIGARGVALAYPEYVHVCNDARRMRTKNYLEEVT